MNNQNTSNNPGHGNKLPVIYLWLPIWIALIALGWAVHNKYSPDDPSIPFEKIPEPVVVFGIKENTTTLTADRRGHYVFTGYINNKRVKFLLDTGATSVAIPEHLADYLELSRGQQFYANTANGRAIAFNTLINKVAVGNIEQLDVKGAILPGMKGDEILLGMTFLKNLEMTQKGGEI